ncbi:MAG: hypothetical protein ACK5JE_12525 [Castellaniella sp.]
MLVLDIPNTGRVYAAIVIGQYLIAIISPRTRWQHRLRELMFEHPDIPRKAMGFPDAWDSSH